jgi:hypothetical protein
MKGQHPDIEEQFPHLKQWSDCVGQRSAVVAGMQTLYYHSNCPVMKNNDRA